MTTQVVDTSAYALKKFSVALTVLGVRTPTDMTPLLGKPPTQGKAEQMAKQQSSPGMPGILVTDLSAKKAGTQVTIEAFDTLGGEAIMGDEIREGKGENIDVSSMSAKIDLSSKVVNAVAGKMIDQRTSIQFSTMATAQLAGYFPRLLWNRAQVQISGARGSQRGKAWHIKTLAQSDAVSFARRMINPVTAPTYNRHLVANAATLVQGGQQLASIASTDVFRLSHIDALAEYLESIEFKIQPIMLPNDPAASYSPIRGVLYLDPQQYAQIKAETTANYNIRNFQALATERANVMGLQKHPLFMGDVLMWNNIVIRPMGNSVYFNPGDSTQIITAANRYTGTESAQVVNAGLGAGFRVSRAIFMGAQAFAVLQGNNETSGMTAAMKVRLYDYEAKQENMGEWMGGEVKLRFSFRDADGNLEPTDMGVIVIDTAVRAVGI